MKLSLFLKTSLFGLTAAFPSWEKEPKGHEWAPPQHGDSRSPCPGLNALANHGFLPRSGKNVDLAAIRSGITAGYNYEPTSMDAIFGLVQLFKLSTTGNISTFNLADLDKHDTIEFDGSLSRDDFNNGDDHDFNRRIWTTTAKRLDLYKTGPAKKDQYVTVESAAKARAARVRDAMKANKNFNASENQQIGSPGTTGLYLVTLWDEQVEAVPKSWVKSLFEDERIPYREGYKLSKNQKTFADVEAMTQKVIAVAA